MYEVRSSLQNCAIPLILKIEQIRNIRFVGNFFQNICGNFVDDDISILTSPVDRIVYLCIIFLTSNLTPLTSDKHVKQHTGVRKKTNKLKSMSRF